MKKKQKCKSSGEHTLHESKYDTTKTKQLKEKRIIQTQIPFHLLKRLFFMFYDIFHFFAWRYGHKTNIR